MTGSTDPSSTDPQREDPALRRLQARRQGLAYQAAAEAVVAILIMAGGGYWLDDRFGTSPILLILGTVLGFASFVLRLLRLGRQLEALQQSEDESKRRE